MKKSISFLIIIMLMLTLFPMQPMAASASFSISGPSTLVTGETGTYTVKVTVSDAAAAQATLNYDSNFFELVSGNPTGVWQVEANKSTTVTLITVKLKCKGGIGTSGSLSLSNNKVSRLTGGAPPSESVSCGGASKKVTVGVPKTPDPNATPKPLEGWEIVEAAADEAKEGEVIEAVMKDDYKIPESLLKQLIDNKNKLIVDFGTYKCTIDPAKLTDIKGIKSLNLELSFEKLDEVSEAAGGLDTYQLHFKHSGELPGMLQFTFKAEGNAPGDTVYLYYYYGEANVMEGKVSAVVDENGMLTFEIYHCSSYLVTSEILPDAISNFDNKSAQELEAANASLEDAKATIEQMQISLGEADNQITTLSGELAEAKAKIASEEAKANEEKEIDKTDSGVSAVVYIISLLAAALISVLLTMLLCKTGIFKKLADKRMYEHKESKRTEKQG